MVVLIDDDTDDLTILRDLAGQIGLGHPVIGFDSPLPAVDHILAAGSRIKLIIADVNMPKLNGFEVRRKLIESGKLFADIPFVFLSTSLTDEDLKKAKVLKAQKYYKKPNSIAEFKEILDEIKFKNGL